MLWYSDIFLDVFTYYQAPLDHNPSQVQADNRGVLNTFQSSERAESHCITPGRPADIS